MSHDERTADWGGSSAGSHTSSSLIRRLQAHDADTWRQWANLYGPLVYYWCRRRGLKPEDAADVLQEVFAAVVGGIEGFEHDPARGRFRGWLWTITRNKIQDCLRRSAPDEAQGGTDALARMAALPQELGDEPTPPEDRRQLTGLVQRAIKVVQAEFRPETWEAFWRTAVEQQETARVAADLGLSAGAVRIAKSRVLRRVRAVLGDLNE